MKLIVGVLSLFTVFIFLSCNCGTKDKKNNPADSANATDSSSEIRLMESLVNKNPDSVGLRFRYIELLANKGMNKEALAQTDSLIKRDSTNAAIWFKKGALLTESGDTTQAEAALLHSIRVAPLFMEPQLQLAAIYANRSNPEALQLADHIIKTSEDPRTETQARWIKGLYYSNINDKNNALKQFDSCIVNDYTFLDAYIEKGLILYDQKEYAKALKVFEKAILVSNTFAEAYLEAGKCEEALGNKDEAISYYKKALGLDKSLEAAAKSLRRLNG